MTQLQLRGENRDTPSRDHAAAGVGAGAGGGVGAGAGGGGGVRAGAGVGDDTRVRSCGNSTAQGCVNGNVYL